MVLVVTRQHSFSQKNGADMLLLPSSADLIRFCLPLFILADYVRYSVVCWEIFHKRELIDFLQKLHFIVKDKGIQLFTCK